MFSHTHPLPNSHCVMHSMPPLPAHSLGSRHTCTTRGLTERIHTSWLSLPHKPCSSTEMFSAHIQFQASFIIHLALPLFHIWHFISTGALGLKRDISTWSAGSKSLLHTLAASGVFLQDLSDMLLLFTLQNTQEVLQFRHTESIPL